MRWTDVKNCEDLQVLLSAQEDLLLENSLLCEHHVVCNSLQAKLLLLLNAKESTV